MKKLNSKDQVLEVITNNPGVDTKTISNHVEYGVDTVRKACLALVKEGLVSRNEVKVGSIRKFLFEIKEKEEKRKTLLEKAKKSAKEASVVRNKKAPKNRSKIYFKGDELGKAKLVKSVVELFIKENKDFTFEQLQEKINFDKEGRRVYPKYDVIRKISDEKVQESFKGKYKRYYVNNIQKSSDDVEFVICREWGFDNIDKDFINPIAKEQLGYEVDNFSN